MSKWAAMIQKALPDEANNPSCQERRGEPAASYSVTNEPGQGEAGTPADAPASEAVVYPQHPAAVALLLACCQLIGASRDELVTELIKLKHLPPQEQIQRWALACRENGLLPERVFVAGAPSSRQALDCMSCKHLEMILAARHESRKQYHWSCARQHAILEVGYLGERILLAPDTCHDYLLLTDSQQS